MAQYSVLHQSGIPRVNAAHTLFLQLSADSLYFFLADDEPNCGQAETDSGGLSPGAIAGISIGCIIIVAVVLVALYWVRHLLVDLSCIFCPAVIAAISVNGCYYLCNVNGFKSDTNTA